MKIGWDDKCIVQYPMYDDYHGWYDLKDCIDVDRNSLGWALLRIGSAILLNSLGHAAEKEEKRRVRG